MTNSENKVFEQDAFLAQIAQWQQEGKRIVFTNGCFDLLHPGHIDNLERARAFGDKLVIGLNSDASVRTLKGPERPIQPEAVRARMLAALACVDAVTLFSEETPYELIKATRPDVLAKGGDYQPEEIAGYDILTSYGGEVRIIPLTEGYSTTNLLEKIKGLLKRE